MSRYVIRATHEDGRRFCFEVEDASLSNAFTDFINFIFVEKGVRTKQLTTIDIDRMDDEPTQPTP